MQISNTSQIRFMAKPGLAELWQVAGKKDIAWQNRGFRDITYIDDLILSNDLILIWKTIDAIVKGQVAH